MKTKVTTKQVKTTATDAAVKATADMASVCRWWELEDAGPDNSVTIAVRLSDSRLGFLKASLNCAFDDTGDWCVLDVDGGGQAHYAASQIDLPLGLRQLIAGVALRYHVNGLFYNLDEEMRMNVPCYLTYVEAKGMLERGIRKGCLEDFVKKISDPDAVGYTDESVIENMTRLVEVCRKLMPEGSNATLPLNSCWSA